MLSRLEISNYALIDNVSLKLESGFTVITGETGAGKSILLKALSLLLGGRADTSVLRQSEKKCFLEAEFDISKLSLKDFFTSNELDYDNLCLIRREFTPSGKSRGFINDTPVQMAQLKELGDRLIAIHSQHQTLQLFDADFQLDVIDAFADIQDKADNYRIEYSLYRQKVNEHIELKVKDMENRKEKDYLSFLINELKAADLDNTNLEDLSGKADKVENAEKISEQLGLARSVFENESFGPQVGIRTLLEAFGELKKFDPKYADIHGRLLSMKIEMDDLASEIEGQDAAFELTDGEAQQIKEKMEMLNSLTFKHNLSEVGELKVLLEKLEGQLTEIDTVEDKMKQLEVEIASMKTSLEAQAKTLSKERRSKAPILSANIGTSLDQLAMENAEMQIQFSDLDRLGPRGLDGIEFQFKTNKGGAFLPIKKVASGGELSRLMLSILSLLSEHKNLPTLIFDEIDTGVSGEVASKIAHEFVKMGKKIQLISITHLAQVAAKGSAHFHVSKSSAGDRTTTSVLSLDGEDRITELAKMISGEQVTDAARENALHLLNNS